MQLRAMRVAGSVVLAALLAACNTTAQHGPSVGRGSTVAFESIDGPPPAVFERLVRKLNDAAEARQVPVVTREGFAPYRIRGYLAVGIHKRRASVAWVWDVYDAQARRTLRLSGEEPAGPAGRDGWRAVTDDVLDRVARSGMEQLAVYFRSPEMAPAAPDTRPTAMARDDFRPESYGITRRPPPAPEPEAAGQDMPLPPRRPGGRVALAGPAR